MSPAIDPGLLPGTVHLWWADLDCALPYLPQLAAPLSSDEQQRAQRFRFEQHQQRYIAGRGILRYLLAHYLQMPPQALTFTYSDRGKPNLADPTIPLQFNLSHSQHYALYAVADRPVGVDLEAIRPFPEADSLVQRFFTANEYAQFRAFPAEERSTGFFQLWTCKEAYLKATGEGLAGLKQAEVVLSERSATLRSATATPLEADWQLVPLEGIADDQAAAYAAAVALQGSSWQLVQRWVDIAALLQPIYPSSEGAKFGMVEDSS